MVGLWTGANYTFLASMRQISASAATSIMGSNAALVCLLGWLMLGDRFSVLNVCFLYNN
jgi:multidrug transporter EmrE-like cation transporter